MKGLYTLIRAALCAGAAVFIALSLYYGAQRDFNAEVVAAKLLTGKRKTSSAESAPPLSTRSDTVERAASSPSQPASEGTVLPDEDGDAANGGEQLAERDLSRGAAAGELLVSSETGLEPDMEAILAAPYPIEAAAPVFRNNDAEVSPLVLILHTHGTEAFAGSDGGDSARSTDITENIVSVGRVLAETLRGEGIPTLHCETMHDRESYLYSYDRSLETVQSYLERYPSIRYIFDVHRDALTTASGMTVKTVASPEGEKCAQVMIVAGTNERGADHPGWKDNLRVAAGLQYILTSRYPGLARPINLRGASFNQQYSSGFLLLEIGSSGNTPEEARLAAVYLARALAELITGGK